MGAFNDGEVLKQHEWVTLVEWTYRPNRIRQGRVVKVFEGRGYKFEYDDPDDGAVGSWEESPWVDIRFGPKNVERIEYEGGKLQGLYRYDATIKEEYEADHYNRHGKYDALKEAELEKRVRSEYESWLGKMYNYGTGGGCGK